MASYAVTKTLVKTPPLTLEELRAKLGQVEGAPGRDFWRSPEGGVRIPKGSITELTGNSKTEWVARFLAAQPRARVAWIEDLFTIHPTALQQRDVALDRVLFVQAGKDLVWTAIQILRSRLFDFLAMPGDLREDRVLRRLQLASEKSEAGVFLFSQRLSSSWAISTQLRTVQGSAEILKAR